MSKMRFFALQELANRRPVPVEYPSERLSDYYGAHVFDRKKMQEFLPWLLQAFAFVNSTVNTIVIPIW